MISATEHQLVCRARQGDPVAISELFEQHYARSLRLAQRILRCRAESEDAVQAAYFSAFQQISSFRGDASFSTWITRIVLNSCRVLMRDAFRRKRAVPKETENDDFLSSRPFGGPSPEQTVLHGQISRAAHRALAKLPADMRSTYLMYVDSELPVTDIATALGISRPAVKSRILRARHVMRARMARTLKTCAPADTHARVALKTRTNESART